MDLANPIFATTNRGFLAIRGLARMDMGVMPWVVGCLTGKNTQQCRAVEGECWVVFVNLFYFLLLFVTFFIARKF